MAKILIVDDSRTSRKILRGILEDANHEIIGEAVNGEDGVAMFEKLNPDIVTLDITMPIMDGVTALKEILGKDRTAKVIMVTAAGQQTNVVEALKIGAIEFVSKPFDKDVILDVIGKALS